LCPSSTRTSWQTSSLILADKMNGAIEDIGTKAAFMIGNTYLRPRVSPNGGTPVKFQARPEAELLDAGL
jgi:hypothetical protein